MHIPRINPVRIKTEPIAQDLINPGSSGYYFPQAVGPRVVYLDQRYDYPAQAASGDAGEERARQTSIWQQFQREDGVQFLDRMVEEHAGSSLVHEIRSEVYARL